MILYKILIPKVSSFSLIIIFVLEVLNVTAFASSEEDNDSPENVTTRIVGGRQAGIADYPYQVSISYKGNHNCGGSIISKYFILTAAHCTNDLAVSNMKVRVGSSYKDKGGSVFKVVSKFEHPKYVKKNFDNDIAILGLGSALTYSDSVQPIALAKKSDPALPSGTMATVSGWGKTNYRSKTMSSHLMAVDVPLIPKETCKKNYHNFAVTSSMICAGYAAGGIDACAGDSGGPLAKNGVQIGIVSWGVNCAAPGYPGVYSSVSVLRDFITEVTGRNDV